MLKSYLVLHYAVGTLERAQQLQKSENIFLQLSSLEEMLQLLIQFWGV